MSNQTQCNFGREKLEQLLASANKRVDRYLKLDLKYYQLKYCCIYGGKAFKTDGKGLRLNTAKILEFHGMSCHLNF